MRTHQQWSDKQLATAIYVYLYGLDGLTALVEELLRLVGLNRSQWDGRLSVDFRALEGQSKSEVPIEAWRVTWNEYRSMPKEDFRQVVVAYLATMRTRKGIQA